ncbi:MAG: NlpC/P60 family protein [Kiloniellales bacterium]
MSLDKRLNAYRPDLADSRLKGEVKAEAYRDGEPRIVVAGLADLRQKPEDQAPLDAQLWYGEEVLVFDEAKDWAWVQAKGDGYVGYTRSSNLGKPVETPVSHWVSVPLTFRFPAPDIKAPPLDRLSMGARLRSVGAKDSFLELQDGGFVYEKHCSEEGVLEEDWAKTALAFLDVPYLWGGRSTLGLDCSGLVQTALLLAGRKPLRDSSMLRDQESLGPALPPDSPRQRGDLLFSPDHLVIALGPNKIVHCNAFDLKTVREDFTAFQQRLAERGEEITSLRRPA